MELKTLTDMHTNTGESLREMSEKHPVFLVFLRHFGCVFCKEALHDLVAMQDKIEEKGLQLVFVHMSSNSVAEKYFNRYGFKEVAHVSDPEQAHYKRFKLTKGSYSQLYGLQTWIRGYTAKRQGHEFELARALGDSTQMPGIFLIQNGKVKDCYIHRRASDRPDYDVLINSVSTPVKK